MSRQTPVNRASPEPRPAAGGSLLCSRPESVQGLTSKISLLALGDVFSLNTLMATGIFTFSPSGIQMPWAERGGCEQEEGIPDPTHRGPEGPYLGSERPPQPGANPTIWPRSPLPFPLLQPPTQLPPQTAPPPLSRGSPQKAWPHPHILWDRPPWNFGPTPDLVDRAKSSGSKHLHLPQLCLFQDPHLSLVGHRSARRQRLHQLECRGGASVTQAGPQTPSQRGGPPTASPRFPAATSASCTCGSSVAFA